MQYKFSHKKLAIMSSSMLVRQMNESCIQGYRDTDNNRVRDYAQGLGVQWQKRDICLERECKLMYSIFSQTKDLWP